MRRSMPNPKFKVVAQVRDVRSVTVSAADEQEAIQKAAARIERTGVETIAFRAERIED